MSYRYQERARLEVKVVSWQTSCCAESNIKNPQGVEPCGFLFICSSLGLWLLKLGIVNPPAMLRPLLLPGG
jgi:hypothetical protein